MKGIFRLLVVVLAAPTVTVTLSDVAKISAAVPALSLVLEGFGVLGVAAAARPNPPVGRRAAVTVTVLPLSCRYLRVGLVFERSLS